MTGPNERDEIAAVLAAHRPGGLTTALNEAWVECSCDERVPVPVLHLSVSWEDAYVAHEQHVLGALTDLLAERDRRTAATALRGVRRLAVRAYPKGMVPTSQVIADLAEAIERIERGE